jgi:ubiquinone/menaquinone biosynthesis C-methylase UbiE
MHQRLAEFMQRLAADVYPEERSSGHDHITHTMAREVVKFLPKGATVLDIGCGQGPALEWFKQEGFDATGTTLSLEDAKELESRGLKWFRADMHDLPFPDASFDCVWARHVMEHSIAPLFALFESHRVIKPNGILYVEVPSPDTSCCHHSNPNHYSVFGVEMWKALIVRTGFEILELRAINIETGAGPDTYFSFICRKK